jgi:hypothetical protein
MDDAFRLQVQLLVDVLPYVGEESGFALKGGTAINLFVRNLPRLSVDIDLTWLGFEAREKALAEISSALSRIRKRITERVSNTSVTQPAQSGGLEVKLHIQRGRSHIKIEVNPTLRGHLLPIRILPLSAEAEAQFGSFVDMPVVSHGELYGSKICAALDRQHPRDLFDVKILLDTDGITPDIKLGLLAGLTSHNRPIAELLSGRMLDQSNLFQSEFAGMTRQPFDYAAHCATFDRMMASIRETLSDDDRAFLLSFESGDPDWPLTRNAVFERLPGVQWKLLNLRKLRNSNPKKHADGIATLERVLSVQ